jgi:hypothetical protein
MFLINNKRVNIDAPYNHNGVTYPNLRDPVTRDKVGVTEVPDPVYPDPDYFYWTENEDGSLNIAPKSPEQVSQMLLSKAKQKRIEDVRNITVTSSLGNTFDGNEEAQGRMARAILAMQDTDQLPWVLENNTVVVVSKQELLEALRLAGQKMSEIWVKVYSEELV